VRAACRRRRGNEPCIKTYAADMVTVTAIHECVGWCPMLQMRSTMNDVSIIDPATARLPANYEAARAALAECVRVDEAKDWADRAAALASYARQIENKELETYCRRILDRAVRRCGEILRTVQPARGANQNISDGDDTKVLTRKDAAGQAGLSERQRVSALRVANVPANEFEELVEGDNPPTVTALADMGREHHGPHDFRDHVAANRLMGLVRRFLVDAERLDFAAALRGFTADERMEVAGRARLAAAWLELFAMEAQHQGDHDG
jgi:hypothetical protein